MRVKIIEAQLPRFKAFKTELVSLEIRTKKVPKMEKISPMPAITIGSRIRESPPTWSATKTSRPSTMVAKMVAT